MRGAIHRQCVMAVAAVCLSAGGANAAVTLFYNGSTTPITINAPAGSSFTVPVKLNSNNATSDTVNGLSYQVQASTSGVIQFVSRAIPASSPFQASTSLTQPQATLNPSNNTDLGAAEADPFATTGAGTFDVANITFMVLANAPAATYTLSFSSTAYGHPYPSTISSTFTALGTVNVFVPEPAAATLGIVAGGLTMARRRRV